MNYEDFVLPVIFDEVPSQGSTTLRFKKEDIVGLLGLFCEFTKEIDQAKKEGRHITNGLPCWCNPRIETFH